MKNAIRLIVLMTNVVQAEIIAPIVIEDLNSLALRDFSVSSELSSFTFTGNKLSMMRA